jgi:hypothetical protein
MRILEKAEAADDLQAAIGAIHAARKNLELIGKLSGELNERPIEEGNLQVNIVYTNATKSVSEPSTLVLNVLPAPEEPS